MCPWGRSKFCVPSGKQFTKSRNRFSPRPAVSKGVGVQVSVQRVVDQVKMEVCGNAF